MKFKFKLGYNNFWIIYLDLLYDSIVFLRQNMF